MDIHQKTKKGQGFSTEQWLKFGEYLSVLAVIPGTLLSVLTGQFAFAASPLALSLWLNLFRRVSGDRHTLQLLQDEQLSLIHRYESVMESTKRSRAEALMSHAGELEERDHPQLINVLGFRLTCIEKNRASLQAYLDESRQTVDNALKEIQDLQDQQAQSLETVVHQLEASELFALEHQNTSGRFEALSDRFDAIQRLLNPNSPSLLMDLESRLLDLSKSLDQFESRETPFFGDELEMKELWCSLESPLISRLEVLQSQLQSFFPGGSTSHHSLHREVDVQPIDHQLAVMNQTLAEQRRQWEEIQQDQAAQLQRLNGGLNILRQNLEQMDQVVLPDITTFETMLLPDKLRVLDVSDFESFPVIDVNVMTETLTELKVQLEQQQQNSPMDALRAIWSPVEHSAIEQIEQLDDRVKKMSLSSQEDQLEILLTPLLQHLSDCDEQFSQISKPESVQVIETALLGLEPKVQEISHRLDCLRSNRLEGWEYYKNLQVQLAMIRFKLEELNSQVEIEMEQIPYLIENYLRKKYPVWK